MKRVSGVLISFVIFAGIYSAVFSVDDLRTQLEELKIKVLRLQQIFFDKNLQFGLRNNSEVKKLQEFLISKEYLKEGLNTGNFFSQTKQALRNFQQDNGLPATGYFGPLTRAKINEFIALTSVSAPITETISPQSVSQESQILPSQFQLLSKPNFNLREIERLVHSAINKERQSFGLAVLVWNDHLAQVALSHTLDQVGDNQETLHPNKACAYPYIRHEGFVSGLYLKDRLKNQNISYQVIGENIIIFPVAKNFIYRTTDPEPIKCPGVEDISILPDEQPEETIMRIKLNIDKRKDLLNSLPVVAWVNQEWLTPEEIAQDAVLKWMNSSGHRKQILTPEYLETGIGAAEINNYIIITQAFLR
jgi:uncharacterized protein YkwD